MKSNPLVLTLDFGTQSLRTALIDNTGEIKEIVKAHYEPAYFSKEKGFAEQEPDFYWNLALKCLKELAEKAKDMLPNIIGCTITTFRDTSVQLDKNLKPLRPCVLWLDQRMAQAKEKLPFLHRFAFRLVGMTNTIELNRRRTIAHWLKENEPEIWDKTFKYVNISTYLTYLLTGNLVDSAASVTGHYPIYFKKRTWYKEGALKGRIFGIPNRMLPELKQPGDCLGTIKDEIADQCGLPHGIKVYATGSDKACETVGLGALSKDIGAISYGTASTIEVSNQKYHEPEKFLPAYPAAVPNWYNMDVQIYRGYWMLTWFSREFAPELVNEAKIQEMAVEELLNSKLWTIPPGSDGLVLQPYWGPGLSRPLAKGAYYKEYLSAFFLLILLYANYLFFVPEFFQKRRYFLFFILALAGILGSSSMEMLLVLPNIKSCFPDTFDNFQLKLVYTHLFYLIGLRNTGFLLFFFVLRIFEHERETLEKERIALVKNKGIICVPNGKNIMETISISDISCILHERNYTYLYTNDGNRYCKYCSLSSMEKLLPEDLFLRVNRNTIIPLNKITHYTEDSVTILYGNPAQEKTFSLSENYVPIVKELLSSTGGLNLPNDGLNSQDDGLNNPSEDLNDGLNTACLEKIVIPLLLSISK